MEQEIIVESENVINNVLSIGEVTSGEEASATITGKEPNQVLNLVLPKGEQGIQGETGGKGDPGQDGYTPIRGVDYWTNEDKQEIINETKNGVNIPTRTSDLTNDSGFITIAVSDLINYYLKSETYSKDEVNTLVSNLTKVTISIVDTLPEIGESNVIYFVPKTSSTNDSFYEYVWISNDWEPIGSTDVDLTGYATEDWVNLQIANFLTEAQVNTLIMNALANYALKSEIPTKNSQLQNDSEYITINDVPNIPAKTSDLQNDTGFITGYTETDPTVPSHVKAITQEDITNWNSLIGIKELESATYKSDLSEGIYFCTKNFSINIGSSGNGRSLSLQKGDMIFIINNILIRICNENTHPKIYFTNNQNYNWELSNFDLFYLKQWNNTTAFTPTGDYNLAHKKYVDDNIKSKINATFTLDGTTLNINTEA